MRELEVMIGLGFLLLMVGYSRRERDSGVLVMAAGIVVMLATISYKIYIEPEVMTACTRHLAGRLSQRAKSSNKP